MDQAHIVPLALKIVKSAQVRHGALNAILAPVFSMALVFQLAHLDISYKSLVDIMYAQIAQSHIVKHVHLLELVQLVIQGIISLEGLVCHAFQIVTYAALHLLAHIASLDITYKQHLRLLVYRIAIQIMAIMQPMWPELNGQAHAWLVQLVAKDALHQLALNVRLTMSSLHRLLMISARHVLLVAKIVLHPQFAPNVNQLLPNIISCGVYVSQHAIPATCRIHTMYASPATILPA
jgi:hypothetical protein